MGLGWRIILVTTTLAGAACLPLGCSDEAKEEAEAGTGRETAQGQEDGGDAGAPLLLAPTDVIEITGTSFPPQSGCRVGDVLQDWIRANLATGRVVRGRTEIEECTADAGLFGALTQVVSTKETTMTQSTLGSPDAIVEAAEKVSLFATTECVCCDGYSYRVTVTPREGSSAWYGDGISTNCGRGYRADGLRSFFETLDRLAR